ncbi:LacI family DNA-binding transcriptional regulator [Isoptericola hypogeus]|uniref:LacI family DNA-binding transcriptional regulator n=1 Tax=Isoptericola hypogeus TaxID=300179 RepID=A0ABP4V7J7_9MICO
MARRITLKDVASRAGVSESAASFALNGRPGVSDATRARVLEVAEALEWRPNHAARTLSGAGTSTIGLVIARGTQEIGSESFFLRLLAGIQDELSPRHYGLLLQIVASLDEEVATYRGWSTAARVDGVLVVDLHTDDPRPAALEQLDLPAVLVGVADPEHRRPAVTIDDGAAMERVVAHLIDTGHRHVVHLCGDLTARHVAARAAAFRGAAEGAGVVAEVVDTGFAPAVAARAVAASCEGEQRPDAYVFDNEVLALAGMHSLTQAGLRVPDDACVVVWEDSPVARAIDPALTALDRDPFTLGAHAARRLLEVLAGADGDVEEPLPSLVVRQSTRCARTVPA